MIIEQMGLQALTELLSNFKYHPILWSLYYVCKTLHVLKPKPPFNREKIEKYNVSHSGMLDGNLDGLRDAFFVDDRKNYTWCELYVAGSVLIVPKEWVPYIVARKVKVDGEDEKVNLFFQPVRFCCRPVLMYKTPTVVRCESIVVDPRRKIHKEMYHTGIGDCGNAEGMFYCNTSLYLGVKHLRNLAMYIESFPLFIYLLQNGGNDKFFNYASGYTDGTLLGFLKHMLVCKDCLGYVDQFVRTVIKVILKEQASDKLNKVYDELAHQGPLDQLMVPYIRYFPDADYDILFTKCFGENKCNDIKVFMSTYFGGT